MAAASKIEFSRPAHSPALSRAARRASGAYYTPPELVDLVLELTMPSEWQTEDIASDHSILDPACGAGEFLAGAARWLDARGLTAHLHGVDIDPAAIRAAEERLQDRRSTAELVVGDALGQDLAANIHSSNSVLRRDTDRPGTRIFRSRSERTTEGEAFDVIVGNPPYLSIRELAKSVGSEAVERLRGRYRTARGNFDLYVLFIERAIELLKPGGRCGLVIPNKWATLDYARPCREMLLAETTIEHVVDLAGCRAFAQASVYPQVVVFRKSQASREHGLRYSAYGGPESRGISQRSLTADAFHFGDALDIEARVTTRPLGEVAAIGCGTAGFAARKIAERLIDGSPALPCSLAAQRPFITSGSIQRYGIADGCVRYLGTQYRFPRLPEDCAELTAAKRQLIMAPKIVVSGMSRRLEAAIDMRGRALGVQVFAVYEPQLDLHYLLALLNSKLLSYLFATRFAGKRLGGGYFAVNKGQLSPLPIVMPSERGDRKLMQKLGKLARMAGPHCVAVDAAVDRVVYELYRLTAVEIERVEGHFGGGSVPQRQVA